MFCLIFSSSWFMLFASPRLSEVNVPAMVIIKERRKKAKIVRILLIFDVKLFQRLSANHDQPFLLGFLSYS